MSFIFTEARRRLWGPAGLYGSGLLASTFPTLNLMDAAKASGGTRLFVDLLVYNPVTFYPGQTLTFIEKALADVTDFEDLTDGTIPGLKIHEGASYASKDITDVIITRNTTADRIEISTTPNSWTWADLEADPDDMALRFVTMRYYDGAAINLPILATAEGDVIGKESNGENFSVSIQLWFGDKHNDV